MRGFYRLLLRIHPADFRERFADEMLCIFDEAGSEQGVATFLADACISLGRQWSSRTQLWKWTAAALGGIISLVAGFGSFLPWQEMWAALRSAL